MLYIIIFLIVLYTHNSVSYVGKACESAGSCADTSNDFEYKYLCEDGVCKCESMNHLIFNDYTLTPFCLLLDSKTSISVIGGETCTSNSSCHENAECVENNDDPLSHREMTCQCKEGFIKLQNACRKVYHQRVLDQCRVQEKDSVLFCNFNESSYCKNGKCICFDNFFANTTSGKCEPVSEYLQMHNLTEYRVRPGEYCSKDSHCIEGLTCVNFNCSCPSACPYKAEDQICDCGEEPSNLLGPLIVGILGGIVIIAFWSYQIRKTIKRYGTKKSDQFDDLQTDDNEDTPAGDACTLKPFVSHDISFGSPGQLNPPSNSTTHPVVPSDAVPPTQPPLYGINPPQAPYPLSPFPQPLQAENPSETNPPPYSINPPTSLPYPIHSSAAPSSTNSTDMPFGLDPSAPVPLNPYGASAPPPCNPNHP